MPAPQAQQGSSDEDDTGSRLGPIEYQVPEPSEFQESDGLLEFQEVVVLILSTESDLDPIAVIYYHSIG